MGAQCYTLKQGFEIQEPFDRLNDTAGIDLGHDVFDGGDRGDGGADEFDSPDDLGGTGDSVPPAQASSSGRRDWVADGGAIPSFSGLPIPGPMGAMGSARSGAGSPSSDAARSVPLRRQPAAHSGEHLRNFAPVNDPYNRWYYGPPIASRMHESLPDDVTVEPARGHAGMSGRGTRKSIIPSVGRMVNSSCARAPHNESAASLGYDPLEGATSAPHCPGEDATEADDLPDVATRKRAPPARCQPRPASAGRDDRSRAPPRPRLVSAGHDERPQGPPRPQGGPRVPIYTVQNPREQLGPHDPYSDNVYPYYDYDIPYEAPRVRASMAPPAPGRVNMGHPYSAYGRPPTPYNDFGPSGYDNPYGLSPHIPMHVDSKTAIRALNGEFVQLESFLDCNASEYEVVENSVDCQLRPLRPRKMITSMYKWMEAWGHYEVTLVSRYGVDLYYELASYRAFILSLTNKYKIPFILTYDERHRAALGRARSFDFSYFNNQLFVTIFDVGSLRTSTKCAKCASVEHSSKECPFRGSAPAGGVNHQASADRAKSGRQAIDPNEVCIRFQDGTCRFKKCPRKHCCLLCGGPDGAKSCTNCAGKPRAATKS